MTAGDGWDDLVKVAVLGTARLAGAAPAADDDTARDGLAAVLAAVGPGSGRSPERSLLAAAAALGLARRAAVLPGVVEDLPAPAPVLDGRPAGPVLVALLPRLLAERNRDVLVEVVRRCADTDGRLPPAAIPVVLDLASYAGPMAAALREVAGGAVGARGRWLAGRNDVWSWLLAPEALPADPEQTWDVAPVPERVAVLRLVRASDPARGRALVERTWRADRAAERSTFVGLLAERLSMEDEPFLEEVALADRAKDVRAAAVRLLDRLPGSRRAARMDRRLAGLVDEIHDHAVIEELPATWTADGLHRGNGNVRGIVTRLIVSAPLDRWDGDPTEVIVRLATDRGRHVGDVVAAFAAAAIHQHRWDWAVAALGADADHDSTRLLLAGTPSEVAAPWLAGALAKATLLDAPTLLGHLDAVAAPWPGSLVAEVLRRGVELLTAGRPGRMDPSDRLRLVGARADPALLPRLVPDLAAVRSADPRLERAFREAHDVAALRLASLAAVST